LERIAVFVAWIIVVFIFIPFSMQSQNLMFSMMTVSFLTVISQANIAKDDRIALFSISHNLPLRKTQYRSIKHTKCSCLLRWKVV
jgi:hypothetical protein